MSTTTNRSLPRSMAAGYELRVREPGHRMFRTPVRDVHVHVYAEGSQEIVDYLDLPRLAAATTRKDASATRR